MKLMLRLFAFGLLITGMTLANIINIPADQPTIQAGIDTANDGDTVLVQPGNYFETIYWNGNNKTIGSLFLLTNDTSYISQTIIDGNNNGSVFTIYNVGESAGRIIGFTITNGYAGLSGIWPDGNGGGVNCISSDIEISNVRVINNQSNYNGAGLYFYSSTSLLNYTTIYGNTAEYSGPGVQMELSSIMMDSILVINNESIQGDHGGLSCHNSELYLINSNITNNQGRGIEVNDSSIVTIVNCLIESNISNYDGGGIISVDSQINISNCRISNNLGCGVSGKNSELNISSSFFEENLTDWQWARGGALSIESSNLEIVNCEFRNNSATDYEWARGGAISYSLQDSTKSYTARILGCLFEGNHAFQRGGAIQFDNRSPSDTVKLFVTIANCEFNNNSAMVSGAIDIEGRYAFTLLAVDSCSIINNSALHSGGGVTISRYAISTVSNTLIASNTSSLVDTAEFYSGGANIWGGANVDFLNCTFTGNVSDWGSGLTIQSGAVSNITNCIFWGNSYEQIALADYDSLGGTLTIDYSDLQGGIDSVSVSENSSLYFGTHILDLDPFFCNPDNGDYAIAENSPCVGTGDNGENIGAYDVGCGPMSISDGNLTIPNKFSLYHNYPNPFNPTTTISYQLPQSAIVNLSIYNVTSQLVETLVNENINAGYYLVKWNASGFSSGLYFYRIKAGDFTETKKCLILK